MKAMRTDSPTADLLKHGESIARALLTAFGIGLLCYIGIRMTEANARVAVVWPANGVVLGLLLSSQNRSWVRTIAWAWLGNLVANLLVSDSAVTGCLLALSNTVEIAIAAFACRSSNVGRRHFGEPLWVARFAVAAIVVAPGISAFIASTVLYFAVDASPVATFIRWFPSDALGMAMCAPVTMVLCGANDIRIKNVRRLIRIALSLAFVLATTTAVFAQSHAPLLYLIYVALGVAIFTSGFSGAVIGLGASMLIAIAFTVRGSGPFMLLHTNSMGERIQQLQMFFGAALAFTYPLSSLQLQRHRLAEKLRASEQRFRTLAEHASDVIMRMNASMRLTYVSPSVREIFGYEPEALLRMSKWSLVVPEDVSLVRGAFERVRESLGRETFNYRVQRLDGEIVWVETILRAVQVEVNDSGEDLIEFIGATRDITERKKVEQALEETNARLSDLAHRDGLTELYNRRFFDEALDREYRRARRDNATEISLLMVDVDFFKQYNDIHGHQAGDECLKIVAATIGRACKRPPDTPARYGGEEFAVILPNTSFEGAAVLAERIRVQVGALRLNEPGSPEQHVTVSIGVASISPYYDSKDTLVRRADEALYRAKAYGRNRIWPAIDATEPRDKLRETPVNVEYEAQAGDAKRSPITTA
ncbi:diguanylate cyclase [Pararobbsia silviterrae]|uniref:diguanylate cyclase n=1 Tax=Pararobbsia silviterrae TaxID=1792498 RepID=A0A494XZ62_9BURK|nr:diguanylate cyclase [Pararobbsia silviterrae]RKP55844.1 diguanylate cyclase [Pararobbsia silviterrae]